MNKTNTILILCGVCFFSGFTANSWPQETPGNPLESRGKTSLPEQIKISQVNNELFLMVERSDWLRYDNGTYIGHTFREVRSSIIPEGTTKNGDMLFKGSFFVLEETLRDLRESAHAVDDVIPALFSMKEDGSIRIIEDHGFPSLRGFPVYSTQAVRPGAKWTAQGERVVDPLNNGTPVKVPILAEYEYKGIESYKGISVYRISANYASRYGTWRAIQTPSTGRSRNTRSTEQNRGASALTEELPFSGLSGSHAIDILIRVSDGKVLFSRDNLDETYLWKNGNTVRFKGFTLTFGQGIIPMDRPLLESTVKKLPGIEYTSLAEGVRLTINNLQFKADSDELLSSEKQRLDDIAAALKEAKNKSFLVEGHTANVGKTEGEVELSRLRAKRVADEMIARGIAADRFIYKGWGSAKPVGDNALESGRAKNRRVEITILE
jgi:outer membrane protein OmpA-like peptidoglycan-associated protein